MDGRELGSGGGHNYTMFMTSSLGGGVHLEGLLDPVAQLPPTVLGVLLVPQQLPGLGADVLLVAGPLDVVVPATRHPALLVGNGVCLQRKGVDLGKEMELLAHL